MSEFKTRAEINAASEFIGYLEQLKSGTAFGTDGGAIDTEGINRALERLSENDNALLQELVRTALPAQMSGELALASGTLSWAGTLSIALEDPITGTVLSNVINTDSISVAANQIAYVVLDRTTDAAVLSTPTVVTVGAYATLLAGAANRLDHFVVALGIGSDVVLPGGQWLRDGYATSNNGATDTQYAQQTEATLLRDNQKDNLNLMLTKGGDISWDAGTGTVVFSDDLDIEFPQSSGRNRISSGSFTLTPGQVLYVTLSRNPTGVVAVTGTVAAYGGVPDTDDVLVIAQHKAGDSRLYLCDGTAISDGETVKLGGVRAGVQFYYREPGLGVSSQIYDLTTLVGVNTEYRVGTGELMVYRNGRKATPSKAFWQGDAYGGGTTGSLNTSQGSLTSQDDYIEEEVANGTGNRIIWVREDPGSGYTAGETTTSLYFAAGTFPAGLAQTFPQSDDLVEIFIGNQGAAPFVTIPDGIYGFELVWTPGTATVRTRGGTAVINGIQYQNDATALDVVLSGTASPSTIFDSETLTDDEWAYIYLGPGSTVGGQPDIRISSSPPTSAGGWGVHPSNSDYLFLTSAYVYSSFTTFRSFSKRGSWVQMDGASPQDASAEFSGAVTGLFESVNLQSSGYLPASAQGAARVQLAAVVSGTVNDGDGVDLEVKQTGITWPGTVAGSLGAIKAGNSTGVQFVFDVAAHPFDVRFDSADYASVASVIVLGYAEGRFTSGTGL